MDGDSPSACKSRRLRASEMKRRLYKATQNNDHNLAISSQLAMLTASVDCLSQLLMNGCYNWAMPSSSPGFDVEPSTAIYYHGAPQEYCESAGAKLQRNLQSDVFHNTGDRCVGPGCPPRTAPPPGTAGRGPVGNSGSGDNVSVGSKEFDAGDSGERLIVGGPVALNTTAKIIADERAAESDAASVSTAHNGEDMEHVCVGGVKDIKQWVSLHCATWPARREIENKICRLIEDGCKFEDLSEWCQDHLQVKFYSACTESVRDADSDYFKKLSASIGDTAFPSQFCRLLEAWDSLVMEPEEHAQCDGEEGGMQVACEVEGVLRRGAEKVGADEDAARKSSINKLTKALEEKYNEGHKWQEAVEVMARAERERWSWRAILEFWMELMHTDDDELDSDIFADLADMFADVLGDDILA